MEAEKLQEAEAAVERMQGLVSKYTKDFLQLKHDALRAEREEKETSEALRIDARQGRAALEKAKEAATLELQQHSSSAKASSEQYVARWLLPWPGTRCSASARAAAEVGSSLATSCPRAPAAKPPQSPHTSVLPRVWPSCTKTSGLTQASPSQQHELICVPVRRTSRTRIIRVQWLMGIKKPPH